MQAHLLKTNVNTLQHTSKSNAHEKRRQIKSLMGRREHSYEPSSQKQSRYLETTAGLNSTAEARNATIESSKAIIPNSKTVAASKRQLAYKLAQALQRKGPITDGSGTTV